MNRLDRQIEQLCGDLVREWSTTPEASGLVWKARDILSRMRAKRRPGSARAMRTGPTRKQDKAARDARRDARWVRTKASVMLRAEASAGGRCEWGCGREINDPHHLLSGSGRRVPEESPETVAAICREDHDGYEANDPEVLARARRWAEFHGLYKALGEIDYRAAKAKRTAEYLDRNKDGRDGR